MKKFLFKNKWIIGLIAVLLVAAVAVAVILGTPGENPPEPTDPTVGPTVALDLPVSEYDVYCVLTEGAIRYGADGKSYEIDTWSLDRNQAMTLTIDMDGIVPRDGRVYRVYVPKAGGAAVFAVPVVSGGMQKADFQRMPIAYRDANWFYNGGMTMKMKITDESVIYYLAVVDDRLRRTEATTVTGLAKFNGECSMDETHSHTNGCYLYNAYLHYSGGFLDPHVVDWAALSVDGSGIYAYIGTEKDTLYACLPGEDATLADVVFTTSDVKEDGTIDVQDLTGREYTCKISAQGVQPVGGRSYRVDAAEDGTTVFSAPDRTSDGYDFKNAPVVDIQGSTVTLSVGKDWNIGDTTRILTARRFWTGWTYLEEVEGDISDISLANRVGSCTDGEDHIHTNNCYYYNAYYKTDGDDTLRWIMTEETGKTLNAALGAADVLPWGSCDPENTVLVTSVYDGKVSVMDMNGAWKTYPYEAAEDLPVYSGALYHAELDNGKIILSGANTSFTQPGFDVTRQPLRSIQGNMLVFSQGENEKVTYLTEDTRIYYMAIGDNRLIPLSAGELQTAQRTGTCQEKGDHICDNNCFYSNTMFACDGQGNLKWLIMSAYNGSIYSGIGSSGNLKSGYADPAQMCLTLSAMDEQGKIEVLQMDGTKAVYTVDTASLPPEKGRLYACTVSGGKITFAEPNDGAKNCVRGGILEVDGNLVTMQNRESFFITEATRIVNVEVRNDKLYLVEGDALGLCQPTSYCKAAGEGHAHNWSKCYSSNAAYATDGAGNLLWMVVRPDGVSLSNFMGNQKGASAQAGDPAKVLLTTSHIDLRDDGTMWISGITMDGTKVSYPLTGDSLIPVKGSMYHMELVDGKAKLSAPNKNHREVGYDLGARPLAHHEGDVISLANGDQYYLTGDTRIYNVEIVGSDMVLTGTKTLTEAKLNCTEEHTHINDCYSYNMFFAADGNDELLWVVNAPADTGIFYRSGVDAETAYAADEAANVVVTTSHTYPSWENGTKVNKVFVVDMTTGTETEVTVNENGLIPAQGKGYCMAIQPDGTALFSIAQTVEVPNSGGYDFARYQILDVSADGRTVLLRNGRLLRVTGDTQILNAEASSGNRLTNITAGGTVLPSATRDNCTGAEHNHTYECFYYNAWYASDADGNIRWILTGATDTTSLYNAQAKETDQDLSPLTGATGFVIATSPVRGGKVSAEDVFGTKHENVTLADSQTLVPMDGYLYSLAVNGDGSVSFAAPTGKGVWRAQITDYTDGVISVKGREETFKVCANTLIRYVDKTADGKVRFVEGSGILTSQAQSAWFVEYDGSLKWLVMEVDGEAIYKNANDTAGIALTAAPEAIVLTTGYAYPEWVNGVKQIRVPVTDMTGKESVLTLADTSAEAIPGKLYRLSLNSDGTVVLGDCQGVTRRAKLTAKDETAATVTMTDGSGAQTLALAGDVWAYTVTSDNATRRITLDSEGISKTTSNYNAIYGVNEANEVAWILTEKNCASVWYALYGVDAKYDNPDVEAPDLGSVPVVLVTNIVANADGTYTAQMTDIYGGTHSCTVDAATTVWPKAGLMYSVSMDGSMAKFETLQGKASSDRSVSYAEGVLSGKTQTYRITANTHIFYVKKDASGNFVAETTYAAGGFPALGTGDAQNCLFGNGLNTVSDGGYVQWIIVGVDDVSLYSLRKTWPEAVLRPTTAPWNLAVITSDITVQDGRFYVTAMDMTGKERTLRIDTGSEILPAKGKLYVLSGDDTKGYAFRWGTVTQPSNATWQTAADMYRRELKAADKEKNQVTIENKTYTLAPDAVLISTERENSYLAKNLTLTTIDGLKTSGSQNTYFGLNGTGEIAWLLNCTQNSIYYIADESLADSGKVNPQLPPVTAAPADIVLTSGEPYPEWVDGTKVIKVSVTDMTGAARTLTLSADSLIPVYGKLYAVRSSSGDAEAVLDYCGDTDVRSAVLTGNADGTLTMADASGTVSLALTADAYQSIAQITDSRMTLGDKAIGATGTDAYNALYGASEDGITWVLTTGDAADITGGLGKAGDAPLMAAPTFETAPLVLVTAAPYLSDGYFVIDMQDIHGNAYTGVSFDNTASVYPKEGQLYTAAFSGNTVTLSQLIASVDRISIESYENGVINEKNGRDYTHKVTANTNICYVDYADNKFAFAEADAGFKLDAYSCYIPRQSSGNYLPWIIVEVDNESIYGKIEDSTYSVTYRNTTDPAKLALVTSEITLDGENCVVTAVDMTGNERTLICDTTGIAPVKGKLYEITTVDGKTSFAYPDAVVSYNGEDLLKTGTTDVIRGTITGFTGTSSFTLSQQGKSFSMGENGVFIPVKRIGNDQIAERNPGASPATSGSMNAMFGVDANGELAWIMIETAAKSIWQVAVDTGLTAAWPTAQ